MPIERITYQNNKVRIVGYHTQECRYEEDPLTEPVFTNGKKAWLGPGYYFWVEETYAHYWGEDGKKYKCGSGLYSIYKAELSEDNIIDAVFNEEGYYFFRDSIHKAINNLDNSSRSIQLYELHKYLLKHFWSKVGIMGIIFDDLPQGSTTKERIYTKIKDLHFEKRIQIVMFDIKNIFNFELYLDEQSI